MSQMRHVQYELDLGIWRVGVGKQKSWKALRVERSGRNVMGRICTSYRYVIDIIGIDPLSLGEPGVV